MAFSDGACAACCVAPFSLFALNFSTFRRKDDVLIVGGGHNGLVAAVLLAKQGMKVRVLEEKDMIGGACKTEYPFPKVPGLGHSTGAYLLGVMPPELIKVLGIDVPIKRRDPHYFLPTTGKRYLLFGSNQDDMKSQFLSFFSESDWKAHLKLQEEITAIRDDIAPTWLQEPLSIQDTAEQFVRPQLRQVFLDLVKEPISHYLERFNFQSPLLKAMYAVTDGFSGLNGTWDTPGTGMNFLAHNMCRLPGSDGTWMVVAGGMGVVTQQLALAAKKAGAQIETGVRVSSIIVDGGAARGVILDNDEAIMARSVVVNADPFRMRDLVGADLLGPTYNTALDSMMRDGTTFKLNLALKGLPKFKCLPDERGQHRTTIHLLPQDESTLLEHLVTTHRQVQQGQLPEFPTIEWYIHTPVDPSLSDAAGHHSSALFVQWVPYTLADGKQWDRETEDEFGRRLLKIADQFAPGTSDLVVDTFPLSPPGIERHFGITRGHIHHIDNSYGFEERVAYRTPIPMLYSCSAGCHPAGSVAGAAGHNAAAALVRDWGLTPCWGTA